MIDSLSLVTPGAAPYQPLPLSPDNAANATNAANYNLSKYPSQKARVLYDYDAKDSTELSLLADEVTKNYFELKEEGFDPLNTPTIRHCRKRQTSIIAANNFSPIKLFFFQVISVRELPNLEMDYVMGERGSQVGKVPKAFLEIISH